MFQARRAAVRGATKIYISGQISSQISRTAGSRQAPGCIFIFSTYYLSLWRGPLFAEISKLGDGGGAQEAPVEKFLELIRGLR
jgi:hypothetical protein